MAVGFAVPAQGADYPLIVEKKSQDTIISNSTVGFPNNFPPARRWRTVSLNPLIADSEALATGDVIRLNLFPDTIYYARIDRIGINVNGTITVQGRIDGFPHGYFLASTTDEITLASIEIPEHTTRYHIQMDSDTQMHCLIEVATDQREEIEGGPSLIPPPPSPEEAAAIERQQEFLSSGPLDPATVDVMVVYSPAAKNWAGGDSGIANVIAQAMAKAQLCHDNSNTIITMDLVHSAEVSYTESGDSNTDLDRLTDANDGYMDEVHTWRNGYGADLVALLVQVDDVGGIGYLLNDSSGRPSYGFSLTRVQQVSSTYTLGHEMGHNMGCHHRKDQVTQPGPGLFDYSAGWRWIGNDAGKYCSIMSYMEDSYGRVAHFSNPSILYQGVATGHSANGDNARSLREIKHVIAAYRATVSFPLTEALDIPSQHWTTSGSADWFGQTDITHDGSDAAQSGDINDNQQSWIQTEVTGPGQLNFWWKVSSESGSDFLRFYLDDVEQAGSISGEVDWQQKNILVPSGSHTLKWAYTKDNSVSSGSDCGWVDQVEYNLTPVYFEDPNLKDAVEEELGVTDLNAEDMLNLTYLNASNRNIHSLVGLEYALNLSNLNLFDNQISDLSAVANLTNLRYLNLGDNQISDPNAVANLTNLTYLYLGNNQIRDISAVANLTNLKGLYLYHNQIRDISAVSNLTNLTGLHLYYNQIRDISAVANLTNLTRLYLYHNQIRDLSAVANLMNLTRLYLHNNQISGISALVNLTNLTDLFLRNNQIRDLSALVNLTNLTRLSLTANPLNTPAYCTWMGVIQANNPDLGNNLYFDPNPNSMTSDCSCNDVELIAFIGQWLDQPCTVDNSWCNHWDLDHNALVDLRDYEILAGLWLQ